MAAAFSTLSGIPMLETFSTADAMPLFEHVQSKNEVTISDNELFLIGKQQ